MLYTKMYSAVLDHVRIILFFVHLRKMCLCQAIFLLFVDLIFQMVNRKSSWELTTGVQPMDPSCTNTHIYNLALIFTHSVLLSREDASYLAFMGLFMSVLLSFALSRSGFLSYTKHSHTLSLIANIHDNSALLFSFNLNHFLFCTVNCLILFHSDIHIRSI